MKLVWRYEDWGWRMFGLLGKNYNWFLGYSRAVSLVETFEEKEALK